MTLRAPEFDLAIIAASDGGYAAVVRAAFGGGELPAQPIPLRLDLAALPRQRREVAAWVKLARVALLRGAEEVQQAHDFGRALFERLFTGEVLVAFRESRAALAPGERLRLRLRLPPALTVLPWELLCDPRDDQFLALAPDLALIRDHELPTRIEPLRLDGPLQVVVVLASPDDPDYARINVERELRRIEAALTLPRAQGRIALDVIQGPSTLDQLRERLRRPVHVLHILSHGDLDHAHGEGVLIFEDADGAAEPINAELLRQYLQRQRGQTRLVLLNACLGALPVGDDPFSSLGAALLRGAVPAVIAMQFELSEDAAAELTRVFYAELVAGEPVDMALTTARLHLAARFRTRLDWAVPVLFLRGDDGVLFAATGDTVAVPASPAPAPTDLPQLWQRALIATFTKRWEEAERLLAQVAAVDARYQQVQERLAEARRQLGLQAIYGQARELREAGHWAAVLGALDELAVQQPHYADPDGLRAWAEAQQRRDALYEQALTACGNDEWANAITPLEEILADFPSDPDAQALLNEARDNSLLDSILEARDNSLLDSILKHYTALIQFQAGNYGAALDGLDALLKQQPTDRETLALVARLIEDAQVPLEQRLRAARLAGQYGDPRPGVCALPHGLDDPYWCGPFPAGSYPVAEDKANAKLRAFRVARYTVTVWQFRQFWHDAQGYANQDNWTTQGWEGKKSERVTTKLDTLSALLLKWQNSGRVTTQPFLWDDPDWSADNQPVVGVSWYEACAFCTWLTARGHAERWLPSDHEIRLPSEAEWEVAAMWDAQAKQMRRWQPPEGELWQNVEEAGIGRSAPVGLFPQGASPCGALDMAGNVWEWCCSPYNDYPNKVGSGTAAIDYPADKVGPALRGESFYTTNIRSSWGARGWLFPNFQDYDGGFRVVVCSCSAF